MACQKGNRIIVMQTDAKSIFIFKLGYLLRDEDKEIEVNKIKQGLEKGLLVLDPHVEFLGQFVEDDKI